MEPSQEMGRPAFIAAQSGSLNRGQDQFEKRILYRDVLLDYFLTFTRYEFALKTTDLQRVAASEEWAGKLKPMGKPSLRPYPLAFDQGLDRMWRQPASDSSTPRHWNSCL